MPPSTQPACRAVEARTSMRAMSALSRALSAGGRGGDDGFHHAIEGDDAHAVLGPELIDGERGGLPGVLHLLPSHGNLNGRGPGRG